MGVDFGVTDLISQFLGMVPEEHHIGWGQVNDIATRFTLVLQGGSVLCLDSDLETERIQYVNNE